ncbi:MAG: hypothetical protein HY238_00380, partial [Acidobacteria bacterium]|nr:hypothetical protein [Acidobacteriota bacterium]
MSWKPTFAMVLLAGAAWAAQDGEGLRLAARYLDERQDFWMQWPQSERGKGVRCVSCHTGVPYLLARPVLRGALGESAATRYENQLLEGVRARVQAWDGPPYYPAKRAQSRGTESIFYALFLAADDAQRGSKNVSETTQAAFENLWAEQIQSGEERGSWEWLNFDLDPWEIPDARYYGTALAAVAVGAAPDDYASRAGIQPGLAALGDYLSTRRGNQSLHNRAILLWASAKLPSLLSPAGQKAIVEEIWRVQNADGGWSLRSLGK